MSGLGAVQFFMFLDHFWISATVMVIGSWPGRLVFSDLAGTLHWCYESSFSLTYSSSMYSFCCWWFCCCHVIAWGFWGSIGVVFSLLSASYSQSSNVSVILSADKLLWSLFWFYFPVFSNIMATYIFFFSWYYVSAFPEYTLWRTSIY